MAKGKEKVVTFRVEMAEESQNGELENRGEADLSIRYGSLGELQDKALQLPKLLAALVKEAKEEEQEEERRYTETQIEYVFSIMYRKFGFKRLPITGVCHSLEDMLDYFLDTLEKRA